MRITGRQLRRIIQEEVSRMMNEADDVNSRNIALLTAIADGKVFTDANATKDEKMTINSLLDLYITKSGDPKLASFPLNSLPNSPFTRKLRAVQASLGIKVDGGFGVNSIMGIVRGAKDPSIEDILDMIGTYDATTSPPTTAAELAALIDQGNKGNKPYSLGPGIVGSTGTGSLGVKVGPGPKLGVGSTPKVIQSIVRLLSPNVLANIRKTAVAMERSGQDSTPYIRSQMAGYPVETNAMSVAVLMDYLDIKPGSGGSLTPLTVADLEAMKADVLNSSGPLTGGLVGATGTGSTGVKTTPVPVRERLGRKY